MPRQKIEVAKEALERALGLSPSARQAARSLGLTYPTFKRRCLESGVEFVTNRGCKGYSKPSEKEMQDLVNKKSIKKRLLQEVENQCEGCKMPPIWMGKPLSFHLDHIDGNNANNSRENLRLLCPNCHSQTPTWGVKNAKFMRNKADVAKSVAA